MTSSPNAAFESASVAPTRSAIRLQVCQGLFYLVPFLVADFAESNGDLIGDLLFSLQRVGVSGDAATVHDYLAQLRLPGDDDVLAEVASLRESLMGAENEAARLKHFRLLVGPLQDTALEELVIETLNEILAGSGYKAEDRPEASGEDFWLVGEHGDLALCEAKGVNSGIRRNHVNQVDNHREVHNLDMAAVRGLLVVNAYREDMDLARACPPFRRRFRSSPKRLSAANSGSPELLRLARSRRPAADVLVSALQSGGGWLEVSVTGTELHGSATA